MSDFLYKLCSLRPEQITQKTYRISMFGSLQVCSTKFAQPFCSQAGKRSAQSRKMDLRHPEGSLTNTVSMSL